jgi:hypothetical protein
MHGSQSSMGALEIWTRIDNLRVYWHILSSSLSAAAAAAVEHK